MKSENRELKLTTTQSILTTCKVDSDSTARMTALIAQPSFIERSLEQIEHDQSAWRLGLEY